ncbi:MAG: hypothetical protein RL115_478 [Bacteroidota bacterium]|jgi:hypothetical protein
MKIYKQVVKILLTGCWVLIISNNSFSQHKYPQDYFRNPVGIPMQLSANFGELRPNHWHMGLDIRTMAKENMPIYAAAEGYIAHIGIRGSSFGRFIVINHPNGLSTLYAHLNDFYPALERYVRSQQAAQESWAVELDFTPTQFPVHKGTFIAYSGNTGGSQGPHLHFEIFDTKTTKRFNPLLFGFSLIDEIPPVIYRLAIYDRSKSVFEQTPKIFTLKNTDSGYIIPKLPVVKTGLSKVSFALQMIDKMNGGGSDNGVYGAKLLVDEEPQIAFLLDSIDYDETHYINAHIDYKHDYNGGIYLQHIAKLPGHNGPEYKIIKSDGVVHLVDTTMRQVTIAVKDAYNNTSTLHFSIQHDDSLVTEKYYGGVQTFLPQQVNLLEKKDIEIYLPEGCMYDTVPAYYQSLPAVGYNAISATHRISNPVYPVHEPFTIRLKPNRTVDNTIAEKLIIAQRGGKKSSFKKATFVNGWITAAFTRFGDFQAYTDFSPPTINSIGSGDTVNLSKANRLVFTPADNFGIEKFHASIYTCPQDSTGYLCDSTTAKEYKWLRFTNDKLRNWIYKFDENLPIGVHHLRVKVEDLVGNTTIKEWWIKRTHYTPPTPKKPTTSTKKITSKTKEAAKKLAEKKKKEAAKKGKTATKKK